MQEMLNRDAVFGGLLIIRTLKAMVDRMIRMARLVSLLIDMLTILFLLLP